MEKRSLRASLFVLEGLERRLLLSADPVLGVMAEGLLDAADDQPLDGWEAELEAADFADLETHGDLSLGDLDLGAPEVVVELPAIEVLGAAFEVFEHTGGLHEHELPAAIDDAPDAPHAVDPVTAPDFVTLDLGVDPGEPTAIVEGALAGKSVPETTSLESIVVDVDSDPSPTLDHSSVQWVESADLASLDEPHLVRAKASSAALGDFALEDLASLPALEDARGESAPYETHTELASLEADFVMEHHAEDAASFDVAPGHQHWGIVREARAPQLTTIGAGDFDPLAWGLLHLR